MAFQEPVGRRTLQAGRDGSITGRRLGAGRYIPLECDGKWLQDVGHGFPVRKNDADKVKAAWNVIGASVQGTSHQKRDVPCQDAHAYRILPDGIVVVAVADGAGSAERSAQGAQCAVESVIASVEMALAEGFPEDDAGWEGLLVEAFRQAREAIVQLAAAEEVSLRAFATTLTCAVACDHWLTVGQIGDGVAVARGDEEELFAATQPQRGEYANETFFLTMDDALQRLEIRIFPQSVEALAVMTDGLMRLAMKVAENQPHSPFFQPLLIFAALAENEEEAQGLLADLLASKRVCDRTDDDKTLVLAAHPSKSESDVISEHQRSVAKDSDPGTDEKVANA